MRIELLGSGGFHPSATRHTACVLLPDDGLLLDAGTAAFRVHDRYAAGAIRAERLDVVLTHAHLDHVVGLTHLLLLNGPGGKPVETVVHARPEVLDAVQTHLLAKPLFPLSPVTRFEALGETLRLPSGAQLRSFPLEHPGGSVGVRVDRGDKSIAYVTDTTRVQPQTIDAIRGVDLLLHEAYFDGAQQELAEASGHCVAADAAWAAAEAGAGRLVLMHANPRATPAQHAAALAEARSTRPDAAYGDDEQAITV